MGITFKTIFLLFALSFTSMASAENLCKRLLKTNPSNCGKANKPRWKMIWHDEFKKDGTVDPTKWKHDVNGWGGGNGEHQFYTGPEFGNALIRDGLLTIEGRREPFDTHQYTSARLNSVDAWTYGRYEFRTKLPKGQGTWPAIWMLARNKTYGESYWIDNGEIDIMEAVGRAEGYVLSCAYSKENNWWTGVQHTHYGSVPTSTSEFHTYAMEWFPDRLVFFIDNEVTFTVEKQPGANWTTWPFDQDFYLIMNLAIGGGFAGEIDDSIFPAKLEIDYMRIYQPLCPEDCAEKI